MASREEMIKALRRQDMLDKLRGSEAPESIEAQPQGLPTKQEQGVGILERRAVNMLKGDPKEQLAYLKTEGYLAEMGAGGVLKVRRPEDKEWKVVDPEGLTSIGDALQDTLEAVPDIAGTMIGGGIAGTGAKVAGKAALGVAKGYGGKIIDRLLSLSPTYQAGKKGVELAKKAVEVIQKARKPVTSPKKFVDPFSKIKRRNPK